MSIQKITSPIAKLILVEKKYKNPVMPTKERPYCLFDKEKVDVFVKNKELAIPKLAQTIQNAQNEAEICEGLYIADRMLENGTKGMDKLYYKTFSKFNESRSPNVQTFLAGIYRKILVPDAFGPLMKMLYKNITEKPQQEQFFDPNEEVGGAILELIRAPKIYPL